MVGRGEVKSPAPTYLKVAFLWRIATSMTNMNDNDFILAHAMIDKIRVAGGRKYANAGDIGLTSERRMSCEQAAR